MNPEILEEQINNISLPKCSNGDQHIYSLLCQKSTCKQYFELICNECKIPHSHCQDQEFTDVQQFLENSLKGLQDQQKYYNKKTDLLWIYANKIKDLSQKLNEISEKMFKIRDLSYLKNQDVINQLGNTMVQSQNYKIFQYNIKNLQEYFNSYINNQGYIFIDYKYNIDIMEQLNFRVDENIKIQLKKMEEYEQDISRFIDKQFITQQNQQFVQDINKEFIQATKFWISNYQQSQKLYSEKTDSTQIYQGTNLNCQYICSTESFSKGSVNLMVEILDIGSEQGKLHFGLIDQESWEQEQPYDPNPNIDIFSGNNNGMKVTKGSNLLIDLFDQFATDSYNYNQYKKNLKKKKEQASRLSKQKKRLSSFNKSNLMQFNQESEAKVELKRLIFNFELNFKDNTFKIKESSRGPLVFELEPDYNLQGKKWRFLILWRYSTVKLQIIDKHNQKTEDGIDIEENKMSQYLSDLQNVTNFQNNLNAENQQQEQTEDDFKNQQQLPTQYPQFQNKNNQDLAINLKRLKKFNQ